MFFIFISKLYRIFMLFIAKRYLKQIVFITFYLNKYNMFERMSIIFSRFKPNDDMSILCRTYFRKLYKSCNSMFNFFFISFTIWTLPRSMIPEAIFREFPAKILRKLSVSDRNPPGSARNSTKESGCWFWQVPVGSGRNRINPVTGILRNRPFSAVRL